MIYKHFSNPVRYGFVVLAALLALAILVVSLSPTQPSLHLTQADKYQHAFAYFCLGLSALPALPRWRVWQSWLALFGFGVCIEILQGLMHFGRTADPLDALANAGGVLVAVLLWWVLSRILKR